jgi:hypothetical protein
MGVFDGPSKRGVSSTLNKKLNYKNYLMCKAEKGRLIALSTGWFHVAFKAEKSKQKQTHVQIS